MTKNKQLNLGQEVTYPKYYSPDVLYSIKRDVQRQNISIGKNVSLPFEGVDIWNAYEISWLNDYGKPEVAIGKFVFSCDSAYIVESKSLKLYLNSLNQTRYKSMDIVKQIIKEDLSNVVNSNVIVELYPISKSFIKNLNFSLMSGDCIDIEDVEITDYYPNPDLLKVRNNYTKSTLYSNLLKSNCLVTNQPDWASVQISYIGREIDKSSLLKYIVSYREHSEFHEHCVERIFMDIMLKCKPESLAVFAKYTRRGGLDINPFRTTGSALPKLTRDPRQ